ncbi:helix-turn-helix transcriptional regulator [Ralstonia chuxiongensis]|uniref:Helix-turn-helix transcriptional regulator n=1 Tax=Ralstonia chuxiongensis TaxID=2957504 RepID=A0AA41WMU0_9RALS|nr:helix-turn-helix transcriptional regulator [Ralstonia chuxiongensis]MCP1171791.1 helix-turn-helix transcriptional regulator [Ralstonia chuxiongensis]
MDDFTADLASFPAAPRNELGEFLRSRRSHLRPQDVGLPEGSGRRRTAGLRREEVAQLANISIDWYVRIEQGRDVRPSVATIEAIGRALKLSSDERAHMRGLARAESVFTAAAATGRSAAEAVPDVLRRAVAGMVLPAHVRSYRTELLCWNEATSQLFMDFGTMPQEDRNSLVYMFLYGNARERFVEWENEARRMLAKFRAVYDPHADDPVLVALVDRLRTSSREFDTWWRQHEVRAQRAEHKLIRTPAGKVVRYDYIGLPVMEDPRLRMVLYVPVEDGA